MPTPSNDAMLAGLVMNLNDYISSLKKYINVFFTPGIRDNFTDALHEAALSLGQACAGFISLRFIPRLAQYNKIGKGSSSSTSLLYCLKI